MASARNLAGLVRAVQDAEHEVAALRSACRWIGSVPGVARVGIVGRDKGWLVGERFDAGALRAGEVDDAALRRLTAPVRVSGATVGDMVVDWSAPPPADAEALVEVAAALVAPSVLARLDAIDGPDRRADTMPEILGRSPAMADLRHTIARAAPTAFPVLIEGESGTGKELVARALHRLSPRRSRGLAPVNCAAFGDDLLEAELFGHARGAFTGAVGARVGLFEEVHGGTLFLDEVGELSARAQAKILRALQEREIRRVGENAPRPVDVRLVAATNAPLAALVASGRFREDLMFRLAVVRIRVPPLRARSEDVPLIAGAYWRRLMADTHKAAILAPTVVAALARHDWPGNVRELQNVMAALAVIAPERGRVGFRQLRAVLGASGGTHDCAPLGQARRAFERRLVADALDRHGGRRADAARTLGLSRQGLTKAMRRLGLSGRSAEVGVA
jgi:DNA-binding NtrC family response regulator